MFRAESAQPSICRDQAKKRSRGHAPAGRSFRRRPRPSSCSRRCGRWPRAAAAGSSVRRLEVEAPRPAQTGALTDGVSVKICWRTIALPSRFFKRVLTPQELAAMQAILDKVCLTRERDRTQGRDPLLGPKLQRSPAPRRPHSVETFLCGRRRRWRRTFLSLR